MSLSSWRDTPLVETGNEGLDGVLHLATFIVVGGSILRVLWAFLRINAQSKLEYRDGMRKDVRRRTVKYFVALAVLSLIVVNVLRFEHNRLKLLSVDAVRIWQPSDAPIFGVKRKEVNLPGVKNAKAFADIVKEASEAVGSMASTVASAVPTDSHGLVEGLKKAGNAAKSGASSGLHEAYEKAKDFSETTPKGVWSNTKKNVKKTGAQARKNAQLMREELERQAKDALKAGKKLPKDVYDAVKAGNQYMVDEVQSFVHKGRDIPRDVISMFPWIANAFNEHLSIWDFFKALVDDYRRMWWTQQWLMGYLTWSIFTGIECRQRGFQPGLAWSLVVLGWFFSLSFAQSLFYVLMLLKPERQPRLKRWIPHQYLLLVPLAVETLIMPNITWHFHQKPVPLGKKYLDFFQILLMVAPMLTAETIQSKLSAITKRLPTAFDVINARVQLKVVWWGYALACCALHWWSTWWAFFDLEEGRGGKWWLLYLDSMVSIQSCEGTFQAIWSILSALGDHAWLNAVGWDIILSLISLCLWACVSSADAQSMLKVTFWPWWAETVELVQEGAEVVEPYVGALQEKMGDMYDTAEPYIDAAKEGAENLQEAVQPYLQRTMSGLSHAQSEAIEFLEKHGYDPEDMVERAGDGLDGVMDELQGWGASTKRAIGSAITTLMEGDEDDDEDVNGSMVTRFDGGDVDEEEEPYSRSHAVDTAENMRTMGRRRTARKSRRGMEDDEDDWEGTPRRKSRSPAKKARGRPSSKTSTALAEGLDDLALSPKKQRASSKSRSPSKRGASRSRTRALSEKLPEPIKRRSLRIHNLTESNLSALSKKSKKAVKKAKHGEKGVWEDPAQVLEAVPRELSDGFEAMALTWGLWIVGGLGMASAGVFGADELEE